MSIENPGRSPWEGFKGDRRPLGQRIKDGCALVVILPIAVVGGLSLKAKDAIVNRISKVSSSTSTVIRVARERVFKQSL